MIRRNRRGDIIESRRAINTRVGGELLIGDGWESVAQAEATARYLDQRLGGLVTSTAVRRIG